MFSRFQKNIIVFISLQTKPVVTDTLHLSTRSCSLIVNFTVPFTAKQKQNSTKTQINKSKKETKEQKAKNKLNKIIIQHDIKW
jgi:hypothetical protein